MPLRFARILALVAVASAILAAAGCRATGVSAGEPAVGGPSGPSSAATSTAGGVVIGGLYGDKVGFDTARVTRKYLDVVYAPISPAEKLDIYLPESGTAPYPVVLAIHGGGFRHGDKTDGQVLPMFSALERGYAVVSINYRLASEAIWPAQINDAKAAVRFLRANAATYSLDPDRIVAWGDSAGGTLAALLGTTGGVAQLADPRLGNAETSDTVRAAVDWFGPIDFGTLDAQSVANGDGSRDRDAATSPESQLLGGALPTVADRVKAADPTTYITPDDPPMLVEHGTKDATIPYQQSTLFAEALTRTLGAEKVSLRLLPGATHLDAAFITGDNMTYVLDWIDAQVR